MHKIGIWYTTCDWMSVAMGMCAHPSARSAPNVTWEFRVLGLRRGASRMTRVARRLGPFCRNFNLTHVTSERTCALLHVTLVVVASVWQTAEHDDDRESASRPFARLLSPLHVHFSM